MSDTARIAEYEGKFYFAMPAWTVRRHKKCGAEVKQRFGKYWSCEKCNAWVHDDLTESKPLTLIGTTMS